MQRNRRTLLTAAACAVAAPQVFSQNTRAGVADRQIHIAGSVDLSGPVSSQVKAGFSGATLYFDQLNQLGGVHGRSIRLALVDDGFDPRRTETNIRQMHREGNTFAVFGASGDAQAAAAIDTVVTLGMPLFAPVCGSSRLRQMNREGVYFVRASYRDEAIKLLRHSRTVGHRRLVVVHQDDAFGQAMLAEVHSAAQSMGAAVPTSIGMGLDGVLDSTALSQFGRLRPDAVVLATVGDAFTSFCRHHLGKGGTGVQVYGFSLMAPQLIGQHLGVAGRGIVLSQFVPSLRKSSTPIVVEYLQALQARKSAEPLMEPISLALEGFLMAKVFSEGLRRVGREVSRPALIAALEQLRGWDAGGIHIGYSPASRAGSSFVELAVVNDSGQLVF